MIQMKTCISGEAIHMKVLKFLCFAIITVMMLTACGSTSDDFAKYLDESHDVIVYDDYKFIFADGYDISSRLLDYRQVILLV